MISKNECKEIAEWFFRQRVTEVGVDYVKLADGTKTPFLIDADNNLVDALEEKMIKEGNFDHISITYNKENAEHRVLYCYYKIVTNIGTSFMMSASGRDNRTARVKAFLKHIRRATKI